MSGRAVPGVRRAVGMRVRALRKTHGLSQERLGEAAALSGKFIGEVERAEKSISIDSLARVAGALGVSLAELVATAEGRPLPDVERIYALVRTAPPRKVARAYEVLQAVMA